MFFNTPSNLLKPIHSLLKSPFDFKAGLSIAKELAPQLQDRDDYGALKELGNLFDEANKKLKPTLFDLRINLEKQSALVIAIDIDISSLCWSNYKGRALSVFGMESAQYLSYVSVQCQLERLYDLFKLCRSGRANPLNNSCCLEAIKVLMLSEALALSIAGIATVKYTKGSFNLTASSETARDQLRSTWFARMLDQSSQLGTFVLAKQLADQGANFVHEMDILTEHILEQSLSISWHRLSDKGRELKSVQHIYLATNLVALLVVFNIQHKPLKISGSELRRYGLEFSDVTGLIKRQENALATDQFIMQKDGFLNVRFEAASKGLRKLFRTFETEFGEKDKLRVLIGGSFYEQINIRQRIEEGLDYQPRYRICEGFDRYQVIGDIDNKCDIDFIIKDLEQKHYYFVQIKHGLLGEKAFFESVIEAIQSDIGKGLHQLREAKRLLEMGSLKKTLIERDITDATQKNSSFILLHNIAQLDFQHTNDGIFLYDWASFRNLLKDAECRFGNSSGRYELIRLSKPLISSHPRRVIQRLLSEHPAYKHLNSDPWAQERATTNYKILEQIISIHGLGI